MKDVLIAVGVAVGIVVLYKLVSQPPASQPTSGTNGVNPTLAGVAGIVTASSGLLDSIKNLVKTAPAPDASDGDSDSALASEATHAAYVGRLSFADSDQSFVREDLGINSGFAVLG